MGVFGRAVTAGLNPRVERQRSVVAANDRSGDLDCDLLVVGGGAAGLSGAVTAAYHGLKVIVAEKASVLGGATSWSGGWMWVPLNPLSQADGIVEDIDSPRTHLKYALGENHDEPRVPGRRLPPVQPVRCSSSRIRSPSKTAY